MLSHSLLSRVRAEEGELRENHINPTVPFLSPLKMSEDRSFSGGIQIEHEAK